VPYKGVSDSQTYQSRDSRELGYNDLCISKPDCTLLDFTLPTAYDDTAETATGQSKPILQI